MSSNLDYLFNSILESEQQAEERKFALSKEKQIISHLNKQVKQIKEDSIILKGQMAVKVQSLDYVEARTKFAAASNSNLREQWDRTSDEVKTLLIEHDAQDSELQALHRTSNKKTQKFMSSCIIIGNKPHMDTQLQKGLNQITKAEQSDIDDFTMLRSNCERSKKLQEDLLRYEEEVKSKLDELCEVDEQLEIEDISYQELVNEFEETDNRTEDDDEFLSYQNELETLKNVQNTDVIKLLKKERDKLLQFIWK